MPSRPQFQSPAGPRGEARFATTRWSIVLRAGESSGDGRNSAWDHFCRTYWYPVYAFVRRRGNSPEDASDLTQGFFAKLIELDWLSRVEKRDTRFSTLLVTILKNHLIKDHQRATADKRGGGASPLSLDVALAERWFDREPAMPDTPETLFEKRWALAVMQAALERLREECDATGKARIYATLGPFLSREPSAGEYEDAAMILGIQPRSVAVAVHRLRQDYRVMIREEVSAGLNDEEVIHEELRALAAALGA